MHHNRGDLVWDSNSSSHVIFKSSCVTVWQHSYNAKRQKRLEPFCRHGGELNKQFCLLHGYITEAIIALPFSLAMISYVNPGFQNVGRGHDGGRGRE